MVDSTPASAKRRRINFETQKAFEVLVGSDDEQKSYTILEDLVVHRSSFLKSARSSAWTSGAKAVDLTDEDTTVFEDYLHCVDSGEVDVASCENGSPDYSHLIRVYILADKLGDLAAANLCIDHLVAMCHAASELPSLEDIRIAYCNTTAGSKLRSLIIDWHVHEWEGVPPPDEPDFGLFPPDMICDVLREALQIKNASSTRRVQDVLSIKAKDRPKIEYTSTFAVVIGTTPSKKTYTLPSKTFSERSGFLKAALSSRWRDGDTPIEMNDMKPATFEDYIHCVTYDEVDIECTRESDSMPWSQLIDLYVLTDRMMDPQTANLVMDHIIKLSVSADEMLPGSDMRQLYQKTAPGSPLRKLALEWALHEWQEEEEEDDKPGPLPLEMLTELFREYRRLKKGNGKKNIEKVLFVRADRRQKCYFHQHNDDHPKCK
nr:hypothetical protein B0A51_12873 [Rachicladosporium sp. CCFEE 5018]